MKRTKENRRRRAVLLIEVVALLLVLAVVMMLGTQMVIMMVREQRAAEARDTLLHRTDTAIEALRRDAWGATAIHTQGTANLVEMQKKEGTVVWEMGDDGHLTRRVGNEAAGTWVGMPKLDFSAEGPRLTVGVETPGEGKPVRETVTVVSQRMLAGGGI